MSDGDVSSRIVGAMRDFSARKLGPERAAQLLAEACRSAGTDPADADDERAYVSLDAFFAVADAYKPEVGDDVVLESVVWVIPRRKDFSAMSLSAIATPGFFYANLDRARSFYAQHVSFEVSEIDRRSASVALRYREGVPRRIDTCHVARGVLMAIPLLFGLPVARVEHERCYADGADHCEYRVSWRGALPGSAIGALGGAAVTAGGAALMWHPLWLLFPVLGWLVGRAVSTRGDQRLMAEALEEQRRALGDAERDFQRRFREIRQLEESLQRSNQQLAELHARMLDAGMQAQIGELAGELAHEIRNPLTYVLTNLDLLEEDLESPGNSLELEEMEEVVSDIRAGVDQMRGVMEWFLDVCRGPGSASRTPLDLNDEIERTVSLLRRDWGDDVQVHCRLGQIPPIRAYGRQLVQVLVNLLINARQATDRGNIWIETAAADAAVRIQIRDDGDGMSDDQLRRAFDRGFTTKTDTGTGLGLTISRAIVEKHGGSIRLESEAGRGTTVTVEVPTASEPAEKMSISPAR